MRAIVMREPGGPEVLALAEVPVPAAGPGQVLVRTEAIGVSYYETLMRAGAYPMPNPVPSVFGFEAAGTVTAVGSGVAPTLVGSRVCVWNMTASGSYAEYVAAPLETTVPIPDGLSSTDAVAVVVQGAVALCLLRAAQYAGGESMLVEAGAGGVGGYLIQLARRQGAGRIVATASSPAKRRRALELGADLVEDHTDPDWPDRVREALAGATVDVLFEAIGGTSTRRHLDALTPGTGRIVIYGRLSGEPPALTTDEVAARGLTLIRGSGGDWVQRVQDARAEALELAAAGEIRSMVDGPLPLAGAAEAHHRIEDREAIGKVVLTP
jgi:NADPH:quinone reductase-like Zn-dependent oxidoreductase